MKNKIIIAISTIVGALILIGIIYATGLFANNSNKNGIDSYQEPIIQIAKTDAYNKIPLELKDKLFKDMNKEIRISILTPNWNGKMLF